MESKSVLLRLESKSVLLRVTGRRSYDQRAASTKPVGLWVSVAGEDDWPSWCHGEDYGISRLAVRHRVSLKPAARIMTLTSGDAIDAFHDTYAGNKLGWPDWRRVAAECDGIIIAPYQWSHRLMKPASSWYYGWDCASGCIWNARAIAAIEVVAADVGANPPNQF